MKTLVKCPHCASDLEVNGAGRFQCHECGQDFTSEQLQEQGVISTTAVDLAQANCSCVCHEALLLSLL